ncbi:MAG: septal ring lytic transglycosylase RlpA family protein [Pseudomonadota bacterium]|nr:septal ring lytic transglycosylase RlpA family protein [Pseudomonadota bacterium]
MSVWRFHLVMAASVLLAACGSAPKKTAGPAEAKPVQSPKSHVAKSPRVSPYAPAQEDLSKRGDYVAGGLYAPGVRDTVPDYIPNVDAIPEPDVVHLPRSRIGNRSPYSVLGKSYTVLDDHSGYVERGRASYYGNKFHGRRTSNQEVYDMYAFSAAHRNLPLPSFARITNLDNGKSVVVRVNDRGPFHSDRLIDLSYAAAVKLGFREAGTANVEVRALDPAKAGGPTQLAQANTAAVATGNPVTGENRFDMFQDGRPMSADQFDAWMRQRQIRIATGVAGKPDPALVNAAAVANASAQSPARGPAVELQVASFASVDNARRALGLLQQAGVPGARLLDATVDGRRIWRLRVGPLAESATSQLAAQITGLGFGQPAVVRQ